MHDYECPQGASVVCPLSESSAGVFRCAFCHLGQRAAGSESMLVHCQNILCECWERLRQPSICQTCSTNSDICRLASERGPELRLVDRYHCNCAWRQRRNFCSTKTDCSPASRTLRLPQLFMRAFLRLIADQFRMLGDQVSQLWPA